MNANKVLAIIPARSGSKGVPGKNIKKINGLPLITWTIKQALSSKLLNKVIVSTDGEEIAAIAKESGGEIPFIRPAKFAQDDSPTSDVVIHAINFYSHQGIKFDMVAVLEPTSPLRKISDIDRGIKLLKKQPEAYSLVSVGEVHTEHPLIVKKIQHEFVKPYWKDMPKIHQRQQADMAFFPYGVLYLSRVEKFLELKTFYTDQTLPMKIERWQNYEIDDALDFEIIEMLMKKYSKIII